MIHILYRSGRVFLTVDMRTSYDKLVEECHALFQKRLVMILRPGSSPYRNLFNLRDTDLIICLEGRDESDLSRLHHLFNSNRELNIQCQLIYQEDIHKDLSWYSFCTNGPHVVFELLKAELLYGTNIFAERELPKEEIVKISSLMKIQQYLTQARQIYFQPAYGIPISDLYTCLKRVKLVVKDALFLLGVYGCSSFTEELQTYVEMKPLVLHKQAKIFLQELVEKRADEIIADLSIANQRTFLVQIIDVMDMIYADICSDICRQAVTCGASKQRMMSKND